MVSKGYRDLVVWQKAMDLVDRIYQVSDPFPNQENFGLTAQMRRCAVSIPSNIAEGQSRNSEKEFLRFLNIALGSLAELDTQTEIALRQGFLNAEQSATIINQIRDVRKMIYGLIKSLKN